MENQDILFEVRGQIGLITLNRPKALNALNAGMCLGVRLKLGQWASDEGVKAVVVRGAGGKAFCAGGDVVSLYKSGMAYRDGDKTSLGWRRFFTEEYRMNVAIKEFPKPYIAILDGITMGGGVGISVHGGYRIATERTLLAMPETGLGLIPEVGGGWFLPRLEDEMGMYLALTGDRLGAAETCDLGITQSFCPSGQTGDMIATLAKNADDVGGVIARYSKQAEASKLLPHKAAIQTFFSGGSVEDIVAALGSSGSDWAKGWHKRLMKKSPTSMKLTYQQMRKGKVIQNFRDNMKMEYRIVNRIIEGHDFYEGVRAILIDKDNHPRWRPASLEEVSKAAVAAHFEDLGEDELRFD